MRITNLIGLAYIICLVTTFLADVCITDLPFLGVLENLTSRTSTAELMARETPIIKWLVSRIQAKESSVSQNKQYSAEVLAILLQSAATNRAQLIESDGIDILLQLLSPYRKRDPAKGTEEEEYIENLFDCITCCLDDRDGKEKFVLAEGIELCLIMLRDGKMSKPRALRLLDHALGGPDGAACCDKLVEAAGLKVIFTMFMKKVPNQTLNHNLHSFLFPNTSTKHSICSMTTKPQNTSSVSSPPCCARCPPTRSPGSASSPNSSRKTTRNSTA